MDSDSDTITVYHYSKRPIHKWGDFTSTNIKSRHKIGRKGKPIGLWYAYETSWRNLLAKNEEYNIYAFHIPADRFIRINDSVKDTRTKILKLETIADLETLFELTGPGQYQAENTRDYEAATSGESSDTGPEINWPAYWKMVSSLYGGIEFSGELIKPRESNDPDTNIMIDSASGDIIDISWLRDLDIVSGVIFEPQTFFEETPPTHFLQRGSSRTRRLRKPCRRKTRTNGRIKIKEFQ